MKTTNGPIIDMTPSGHFAQEPITGPTLGVILARVLVFTIALGFAALAFWLAVFTVPILIVIGLVGYGYFRFKTARGGFSFDRAMSRGNRP
jgi:fatty acid desaturase